MLGLWPTTQKVTVIAHSLGSVVAADLVGYVPADSRVRLVTLGSPLALDWFHDLVKPLRDSFPFDRVESWINCFDRRDEVTIGRGLGGWCSQVLDLAVDTRTSHGRADYHHCPAVGAAIAASL